MDQAIPQIVKFAAMLGKNVTPGCVQDFIDSVGYSVDNHKIGTVNDAILCRSLWDNYVNDFTMKSNPLPDAKFTSLQKDDILFGFVLAHILNLRATTKNQ